MYVITLSVILIIWLIYGWIMRTTNRTGFCWSKFVFPLLILSIILTIDFSVNYVAAGVPALNDGISLHGFWSYYFLGDENWNIFRFYKWFKASSFTSMILFVLYVIALIYDQIRLKASNLRGDA